MRFAKNMIWGSNASLSLIESMTFYHTFQFRVCLICKIFYRRCTNHKSNTRQCTWWSTSTMQAIQISHKKNWIHWQKKGRAKSTTINQL